MNNPFYYTPDSLCKDAASCVIEHISLHHPEWSEEVENGKMFGVLVCYDRVLWAYSGQILGQSDWKKFVPPVFEYLEEGGYFKTHEAEIVSINKQIDALSASDEIRIARENLYKAETEAKHDIDEYKALMANSKAERERKRSQGETDEAELIRESQFQKAELRRLKASCAKNVDEARNALQSLQDRISELKAERKHRSDHLQDWLFRNFQMMNGKGETKNLLDIFAEWSSKEGSRCMVPPSGSGECCAPKLLQYAFVNGLKPISLAEFTIENGLPQWHGACASRCAPILSWMLQGVDVEENALQAEEKRDTLEILFENESIIAVDKPAGMLSVPGKSSRRSALDILRLMRPECEELMMVHRLDMQTSGVLIAAKNMETYRELQRKFAVHDKVRKTYVALLESELPEGINTKGEISLPLYSDYLMRPRQIVDKEKGKYALTRYEVAGNVKGHTALYLHPVTGRTHQLRVHCAHPEGLRMPIMGDDLYGQHADRLYLHAESIDIDELHIESPVPFDIT